MGKICTLTIPTSIEGINTTIDVGSGCIHHAVFDSGISRNRMYDILQNGDFSGSSVFVITDDIHEFTSLVNKGLGTTVSTYEAGTVAEVVEVLNDIDSVVSKRYDILNNANKKNIECYNTWADKHNQMKPVVIYWLGADKVLKQMKQEETYELLKTFLRLGRAAGVTLLLHSDRLYGIREAVDNDIYAQFVQIHIPIAEDMEDMTVLTGDKEYRASVVQKDKSRLG